MFQHHFVIHGLDYCLLICVCESIWLFVLFSDINIVVIIIDAILTKHQSVQSVKWPLMTQVPDRIVCSPNNARDIVHIVHIVLIIQFLYTQLLNVLQ